MRSQDRHACPQGQSSNDHESKSTEHKNATSSQANPPSCSVLGPSRGANQQRVGGCVEAKELGDQGHSSEF